MQRDPRTQMPEQIPRLARRRFFIKLLRRGRMLPAGLSPALWVSDDCRNHQVCAAVCPTAALRVYASDARAATGIALDAGRCIACGDCTRACPERALTLAAQREGSAQDGVTVLTRWNLRDCRDCGDGFADPGPGVVCPTCRKTRALARTDFSRLFSSAGKGPP